MSKRYDLNEMHVMLSHNQIEKFIQNYEAKFEDSIDGFAQQILSNIEKNKIILISGSSSSGKTTFSLKLTQHLKSLGIKAQTVSLDDFFLERNRAPKKEDGSPDYETVYALDLGLIDQCFCDLLDKQCCYFPKFDFITGELNRNYKLVELKPNSVILVEGLHALNDLITSIFPKDSILKAYIDVNCDVYLKDELLFKKNDVRFMRRLVRDFYFRASSPENTFSMWTDVLLGDKKYVLPFEDRADVSLSTFFPYDAGIIKPYAYNLLGQIKKDSQYYDEAKSFLDKLSNVEAIDEKYLPSSALIREFIGGSIYYPDNDVKKD